MTPRRPPQHALADLAVNAFERQLLDVGWVWNPTRSGSDYGIDGFVTPTNDIGETLSFEIPIQIKGVGNLNRRGGFIVGHAVSRDAVDILRTHVLCGYFIVYDGATSELYYCSANAIGEQFDATGGRRKRLQIPAENIVDRESLRELGRRAADDYGRLLAVLGSRSVHDAAQRIYLWLSRIQHLLFEFIAAISLADSGNLMHIYSNWAQGIASEQKHYYTSRTTEDIAQEFMDRTADTLSEYEIALPITLLSNFPAASAMLISMQLIIHEIDEFATALDADSRNLYDELGLAGLRSIVKSALDRSFKDSDGQPLPLPEDGGEPRIQWLKIDPGHYFLSTAQVALVVNRLVYELSKVVFPEQKRDPDPLEAPRVWIRHRTNE
jgi:Domain of unknown function (DUF4365)